MALAQKLSMQLRAAEHRINQLEAEVELFRDRAARANRQLTRRYVANERHCWCNVDRANRKSRCGWNWPRGWMLSGLFGRGAWSQYRSRILDRWATHTGMLRRCHSRRCPSILVVLRFAALNPFYGADRSRMRCWEGIASRVPPQCRAP